MYSRLYLYAFIFLRQSFASEKMLARHLHIAIRMPAFSEVSFDTLSKQIDKMSKHECVSLQKS